MRFARSRMRSGKLPRCQRRHLSWTFLQKWRWCTAHVRHVWVHFRKQAFLTFHGSLYVSYRFSKGARYLIESAISCSNLFASHDCTVLELVTLSCNDKLTCKWLTCQILLWLNSYQIQVLSVRNKTVIGTVYMSSKVTITVTHCCRAARIVLLCRRRQMRGDWVTAESPRIWRGLQNHHSGMQWYADPFKIIIIFK